MKPRSKLIQTRGTSALLAETAGKAFGALETCEVYREENKVTSASLPQVSFAERIGQFHYGDILIAAKIGAPVVNIVVLFKSVSPDGL